MTTDHESPQHDGTSPADETRRTTMSHAPTNPKPTRDPNNHKTRINKMYSEFIFTKHVKARMRQRGYRDDDIHLALGLAKRVKADRLCMTDKIVNSEISRIRRDIRGLEHKLRSGDKDATHEIGRKRRVIQTFDHLRGLTIIIKGKHVITLYWSDGRFPRMTANKGKPRRPSRRGHGNKSRQ